VLSADQAGVLAAAFDVTAAGNFEGRNILHPVADGRSGAAGAAASRREADRRMERG
jgi:uncharacterized protein YyaL (SSP411 family)